MDTPKELSKATRVLKAISESASYRWQYATGDAALALAKAEPML